MTNIINTSDELETRIQFLESNIEKFQKFSKNFNLILAILTILGIGGATVISLIFRAERIATKAKDNAIAAWVKADSAARAANIFLEKIKTMDIYDIKEELEKAEKDYHNKSHNLDSVRKDYNTMIENLDSAVDQYNSMIKQLTESIDLYIIPTTAAQKKEYLKGYGVISKESNQATLEGKDALRQRVSLTFDDTTKSIFSVLARAETLKVKFLFPQ